MKTNTPYTIQARNVVFTAAGDITVQFRNGTSYTGPLEGLAGFARDNGCDAPQSCYSDGHRHGVYPCIEAVSETLATALSVLRGTPIQVGDGATFSGRLPLIDTVRRLAAAGVEVPNESLKWGITDAAYTNDVAQRQELVRF